MSDLKTLANNVKELKSAIEKLNRELSSTCDNARYNAIPKEKAILVNKLYDACGDFRDALKEATGFSAYQLDDLTTDHGYTGGMGIDLPKRIQATM